MFSLLIALLTSPLAEAKPDPNERFPKQFVKLLQKGGWTPTPTNSGRYQLGDVFDFSSNEKILAGSKCLEEFPDAQPMADINIINMLKGGLTVPFGVFKGKAKGKRYKKSTFANTVVSELDQMDLSSGYKEKCRRFLRQRNNPNLRLIKAIIQSQVTEQECSGKEVEFGFRKVGVGAETYERCDQDAQALVTIAYQLVPLSKVLSNVSAPSRQPQSSPSPPVSTSEVAVQGGGKSNFAELARKAKEAEAAKKAFEAAVNAKLDAAESKIKQQATQDWSSVRGLLKGGGKSVISIVEKYIADYGNVQLSIEGRSRSVSISEVAAAQKWLTSAIPKPLVRGDGYEAVLIPAGSFTMGCTREQGSDCYGSEKPSHSVRISRSFYMMKSEVTQGLYKKVMGKNPKHLKFTNCGSDCPVERVSWYDAVRFANQLSRKEGLESCYSIRNSQIDSSKVKATNSGESATVRFKGLSCTGWRLPTEAEWEYAARGGQSTKYAGSNDVGSVAWYGPLEWKGGKWVKGQGGNSGEKTHSVCGKKKNGYGLCDMSGNVWEWVWDWKGSYSSSSQTDPTGPSSGSNRVRRGGSWGYHARNTRVSGRYSSTPSRRGNDLGFRLSRSASAQ